MSNPKDVSGGEDRDLRQDPLMIQSVVRAFALLESFAGMTSPRSLSEAAAVSGMDRSAVQRLAHTMVSLGYIERTPEGLRPGRKSLDRACDYLRSSPLIERATPVIIDLRRNIGERVDLSIFDDLSMLFAVRLQSKRETFIATLIGRRVPTFCSSGGRAVLAALPDQEVSDILLRSDRRRYTTKTKVDIEEIMQEVANIREKGFAVATEELLPGEVSIGAAVLEHGRPVAGIHVASSLGEWSVDEFTQRAGPLVVEAAQALRR
jgi:IclR family transcriptional regulator, pca regulon regulatory protein